MTNPANYDPAKANPFPDLPELLVTKDGTKVTKPEQWWNVRRPEIIEVCERELIGRVPKNAPKVTWEVARTVNTEVGGMPVVAKQVIGHVDNSAHPAITVGIRMAVVVPAAAKARVPVLMMFGFGGMPGEALPGRGGFGGGAAKKAPDGAAPKPRRRLPSSPIHRPPSSSSPRAGAALRSARRASRPTTAPASPRGSSASRTKASRARARLPRDRSGGGGEARRH